MTWRIIVPKSVVACAALAARIKTYSPSPCHQDDVAAYAWRVSHVPHHHRHHHHQRHHQPTDRTERAKRARCVYVRITRMTSTWRFGVCWSVRSCLRSRHGSLIPRHTSVKCARGRRRVTDDETESEQRNAAQRHADHSAAIGFLQRHGCVNCSAAPLFCDPKPVGVVDVLRFFLG